tara:strand:- start:1248 stop:1442 length:195 start_codon:yes stop_codon:yes gene_type:complete
MIIRILRRRKEERWTNERVYERESVFCEKKGKEGEEKGKGVNNLPPCSSKKAKKQQKRQSDDWE